MGGQWENNVQGRGILTLVSVFDIFQRQDDWYQVVRFMNIPKLYAGSEAHKFDFSGPSSHPYQPRTCRLRRRDLVNKISVCVSR